MHGHARMCRYEISDTFVYLSLLGVQEQIRLNYTSVTDTWLVFNLDIKDKGMQDTTLCYHGKECRTTTCLVSWVAMMHC